MATWHSPAIDFMRLRVASNSWVRPYAKRLVEDARSLLRWWRPWQHLEDEPPENLFVEPTNVCNANCVFCAYQYQDRLRTGRGVMSAETFERALDGFGHLAGRVVDLTPLVGEPLLDPALTTKVRAAKARGFRVGLFTNGIRLNRIDLVDLLESGIDTLRISVAPFDRASFEALYRSQKYDDLRDGVHRLLTTRREIGSTTRILIQFRANVPLSTIVAHEDFQTYVAPHVEPDEYRALYAQVRSFDSWGDQIGADDLLDGMALAQPPKLKFRPCLWTFSPVVLYDGRVRACAARFGATMGPDGRDDLEIGNLAEEDLPSIWRGDRLKRLRRSFGEGCPPDVCESCSMYRAA